MEDLVQGDGIKVVFASGDLRHAVEVPVIIQDRITIHDAVVVAVDVKPQVADRGSIVNGVGDYGGFNGETSVQSTDRRAAAPTHIGVAGGFGIVHSHRKTRDRAGRSVTLHASTARTSRAQGR